MLLLWGSSSGTLSRCCERVKPTAGKPSLTWLADTSAVDQKLGNKTGLLQPTGALWCRKMLAFQVQNPTDSSRHSAGNGLLFPGHHICHICRLLCQRVSASTPVVNGLHISQGTIPERISFELDQNVSQWQNYFISVTLITIPVYFIVWFAVAHSRALKLLVCAWSWSALLESVCCYSLHLP